MLARKGALWGFVVSNKWEEQTIQLRGPKEAMKLEISTVYRELAIVDTALG